MDAQQHTEREPSAFRMIATLGVAGFLAGVILVSIFQWTKPMIDQHRADALEAAIFEVLEGAHTYTTLRVEGESLAIVEGETDQPTIYAGKDSTGALIGFAGPRVIRDTVGKDLPKGFQSSEFVLDHGFLDFIVDRRDLKKQLSTLLRMLKD